MFHEHITTLIERSQHLRVRWRLRLDAWRFLGARADYYEYLADLIEGTEGRKTLREIFLDDAQRYGPACVRGRLAGHWALAYQEAGGDLALAWSDSLPPADCLAVACAQEGGGALVPALRDLARAARLVRRGRDALLAATAAGGLALLVACAVVCAVPFFTVPRLQAVFDSVPTEYYGGLTHLLFGLATSLRQWLAFYVMSVAALVWLVAWSLPNLTGPLRVRLDHLAVWRLYRDFHAIRFLSMLCVLVRKRGNLDTRLRQALLAQTHRATPWFAGHVSEMLLRIDVGLVGPETFDTGLLDRETWWFMADMMVASGLERGLAQARTHIESNVLARLQRQAQMLRWISLLGAVAIVMALALLHYGVIDELRRALANFYASQ